MRLTRCSIELPLHLGQVIDLPAASARYLAQVLRLRLGDCCVLFNGDGYDYSAVICALNKQNVQVRIESRQAVDNESSLGITLLQGIARGEKMDLILQKATELGVNAIIPVNSQRSEVRLDANRAEKRVAHWQAVVTAACAQCGRAYIPLVAAPQPLAQALSALPSALRLFLDPAKQAQKIAELTAPLAKQVILAIGPEGGWSARDREQLTAAGFHRVRLGPRILRTETAGLAAMAVLQTHWGDF